MGEALCLSVGGPDDDDANLDNIVFTIKDKKLFVPVVTLSAKGSKPLSKGFKRSVYWNEYKTKSENKKIQ